MKAIDLLALLGSCDPNDEIYLQDFDGYADPVESVCGDVRKPHVVILLPHDACKGGLTDGD